MNPALWNLRANGPVTLFFALRPDEAAGATIENLAGRLKRAHRLKGRPIDRGRLHNTLALVHDTESLADNIRRAKAIGDRLWRRSFSVRFDWTASFRHGDNRYPFVLRGEDGASPLADFRAALRDRMLRGGFAVDAGFTPHVTLLWADRRVDEDYPVAPIAWTVRDFVLIASLQGQSRHIEVARWPLG